MSTSTIGQYFSNRVEELISEFTGAYFDILQRIWIGTDSVFDYTSQFIVG